MGWIVVATSFSFVVTQLDVTIVNVALPRIASSLSVQVAGLQWVVDAYTLPFAVLMLSAVLGGPHGSGRTSPFIGLAILQPPFRLLAGWRRTARLRYRLRAPRRQGAAAALLIPSSLALSSAEAAGQRSRPSRARRGAVDSGRKRGHCRGTGHRRTAGRKPGLAEYFSGQRSAVR